MLKKVPRLLKIFPYRKFTTLNKINDTSLRGEIINTSSETIQTKEQKLIDFIRKFNKKEDARARDKRTIKKPEIVRSIKKKTHVEKVGGIKLTL